MEDHKSADTFYSGYEHQRELAIYEKKNLLFGTLITHLPDSKRRSSFTLVRELICNFSFWTAKIETHSDNLIEVLQIPDKRVRG